MELKKIFPNPCEYVKNSCKKIISKLENVKINREKILEFTKEIIDGKKQLKSTNWSESHFSPEEVEFENFLRYIFIIDTLNFCFWPNPPFEYNNLAKNLYETLKKNPNFFELDNLINVTSKDLIDNIFKINDFNLIEERTRMIKEVFYIIKNDFGSCFNFIKNSNKNAVKLIKMINDNFYCFRDQAIYKGEQIFFYKRAQILVSDLHLAYKDLIKKIGKNEENEILNFDINTLQEITMFADYRVPQILRELNILEYSNELSNLVDNKIPILHSSVFEIEIRAATIQSIEEIKFEFQKNNLFFLSLEIDVFLWEEGEKVKDTIKPHHRTLSVFY